MDIEGIKAQNKKWNCCQTPVNQPRRGLLFLNSFLDYMDCGQTVFRNSMLFRAIISAPKEKSKTSTEA